MNRLLTTLVLTVCLVARVGGAEPLAVIPRTLPPAGIKLADADVAELNAKLSTLQKRIDVYADRERLPLMGKGWPVDLLLPDVLIYSEAVATALKHDEFFAPGDVKLARDLLQRCDERLRELESDKRPVSWQTQVGPVVRGFRSEIDGSIQPFGVVIPAELNATEDKPSVPLYVWLHGRGDKQTNLQFIAQRQSKSGEFLPTNGIVIHPFGRYCNAFKYAGESDVFEAINHTYVKYARTFATKSQGAARIVLAGFSMGGAGAWHLGAHYPGTWRAVSPGAGFAETARYQNLTPDKYPAPYEQRLWSLYDVPDYVRNLFNAPVIAYSGEVDKQIQAAQVMEAAYAREGERLEHRIGPGVAHKYEPQVLKQLTADLSRLAAQPRSVERSMLTFQTRTLRYPGPFKFRDHSPISGYSGLRREITQFMLTGLEEHWQDSRFDMRLKPTASETHRIGDDWRLDPSRIEQITTKNVNSFILRLALAEDEAATFSVDGGHLNVDGSKFPPLVSNGLVDFAKINGHWQVQSREAAIAAKKQLGKRPFLQGPIDDAFYDPFMVVLPSGKAAHPAVERWTEFELAHFKDRWERLIRGKLRIKTDRDVTPDDHANFHLIAWGDAVSNSVIRDALTHLPVTWNEQELVVDGQRYPAAEHVPVLIYPNAQAAARGLRYLVINSGPTYREADDKSNSLQTPKLPDWAVIDLKTLPDGKQPGGIVAAGFFDEQWRFKARKQP